MLSIVFLAGVLAFLQQKELAMAVITGLFALMQAPAKKE
jgi:hypothetical protein